MDSLDSLHPGLLRCDRCGWAVLVALGLTVDPAGLRCLTDDEAVAYWPGLPATLRLAAALAVPVERFAGGVEDPAEEEPTVPEKPRRRKGKPL
jgi:hypothetical protein